MKVNKKTVKTFTYTLEGVTQEELALLRDAVHQMGSRNVQRYPIPTPSQRSRAMEMLSQLKDVNSIDEDDEEPY